MMVPEGMMVELIEASRSGTADYSGFADHLDSAIAKVILSQTMTTDNGSSRSQAEVHSGVKLEVG
jgi:phage gp29-like protein